MIIADWRFWCATGAALLFGFWAARAIVLLRRAIADHGAALMTLISASNKRMTEVEEETYRIAGKTARLERDHGDRLARIERELADQTERLARRK